jgi:hypothetical protein
MGTFSIVMFAPIRDDHSCFAQIQQHLPRYALVAETTMELFDIPFCSGLTWINTDRLDMIVC